MKQSRSSGLPHSSYSGIVKGKLGSSIVLQISTKGTYNMIKRKQHNFELKQGPYTSRNAGAQSEQSEAHRQGYPEKESGSKERQPYGCSNDSYETCCLI